MPTKGHDLQVIEIMWLKSPSGQPVSSHMQKKAALVCSKGLLTSFLLPLYTKNIGFGGVSLCLHYKCNTVIKANSENMNKQKDKMEIN